MKKCDKCGYENRDAAKFCSDCGAALSKKSDGDASVACPACGAVAVNGAAFCGVCGRNLDDAAQRSTACVECGFVNETGAAFCGKCGAPLFGKSAVSEAAQKAEPAPAEHASAPTERASKTRGGGNAVSSARTKVAEFEGKYHVIVNSIIAVLAIIVLFVALFAPIEFKANVELFVSDKEWSDSEYKSNFTDTEYVEIEQPFWRVLGALAYVNMERSDFEKYGEISSDYSKHLQEARAEFADWRIIYSEASEYRARKKFADILEEELCDVNVLACMLALSSEAFPYHFGNDVRRNAVRTTAMVTLAQSLLTVALCLTIAITALVFTILAFSGMFFKRSANLFKFLKIVSIASGIGVIFDMASPMANGGVMLGLATFSAIMYYACGVGKAVFDGVGLVPMIRRAATAAALIIAFFSLCGESVRITTIMSYDATRAVRHGSVPVGGVLGELISALCVVKYGNYVYSELLVTSATACVTIIALGIVLVSIAFAAMQKSLAETVAGADKTKGVFGCAIAAIVFAALFAILPSAIGAESLPPITLMPPNTISIKMSVLARAGVYAAIVFDIAAVVLSVCLKPKKAARVGASVE